VTGYGTVYAKRQYSNMFAASIDPSYPKLFRRERWRADRTVGLADDYAIRKVLEGLCPAGLLRR
jgi:endoglucanase